MIPAASCSASSLRDVKVITASAPSGWSRHSWQKKPQLLRRRASLSELLQEEIALLELISDAESCSAVSLWLSVRGDSAPSTLTTKPTNHEPAPPSSIVHFYVHLHSVAPPTPSLLSFSGLKFWYPERQDGSSEQLCVSL